MLATHGNQARIRKHKRQYGKKESNCHCDGIVSLRRILKDFIKKPLQLVNKDNKEAEHKANILVVVLLSATYE